MKKREQKGVFRSWGKEKKNIEKGRMGEMEDGRGEDVAVGNGWPTAVGRLIFRRWWSKK